MLRGAFTLLIKFSTYLSKKKKKIFSLTINITKKIKDLEKQ
jgi:hypothetical protein